MEPCPCGLNKNYLECCGRFHHGIAIAATPEELMRSRYSAYVKHDIDYIARTMTSPALDRFNKENALAFATSVEWLKLEVFATESTATRGFVTFHAHFRENNLRQMIREKSEFHLINGEWNYVDGIDPTPHANHQLSMGRNDLCFCDSGKKYKKCCGKVSD